MNRTIGDATGERFNDDSRDGLQARRADVPAA
jgi:hypothetical protein